ncbi:MAG: phosphate ABC transporter permease PstA [Chlorobi bacterium]|nr:phosphate ABC transporter permease PstA [Chlorobiota bacterium]
MKKARIIDRLFGMMGWTVTVVSLFILALFIGVTLKLGLERLNLDFLLGYPSRFPEKAGILPALLGTFWLFVLTLIITVPIGVSAAIFLEEFMKPGKWATIIEFTIYNLSGVPSVIYGLLGLQFFVRWFGWGPTLISGAATLALLILPVVIVAAREALRAVPNTIREAALALGATRWQTVWHQVLPAAGPGIATGVILALSRAVGETAPILVIGAAGFIAFLPKGPFDDFTALPVQIFNWVSRPQHGFIVTAAAAIIVLLGLVFLLNGVAIFLRWKWQQRQKW